MSTKKEDHFAGTHTRTILSDWQILASIVTKHTTLIKDLPEPNSGLEPESEFHVLSQREIDDAFNGPMQQFFKQKATAYAAIARLRMYITMRDDETFKEAFTTFSKENKIPENILAKTSISELDKMQNELDQLTIEHDQQWEEHRNHWNEQIIQHTAKIDLTLSEIEVKEFKDPEPLSELLDRFVALNIDLPKTTKADMDFSKYLTLKADILIQSALSRQHLPHGKSDIQRILKKLKSDFSAIRKEEHQLLGEQKTVIDTLVANITW